MHSFTNSKDAARNLIAKDKKLKETVYGTIVYVPPQPIVDFGKETWPAIHEKQKVCPRILLVANWTDGRFFLVGGGVDKNESQLEAMVRSHTSLTYHSHITHITHTSLTQRIASLRRK